MEYATYLQEIDRAATATGGKVVSLAGGYFGVQLMTDGAYIVLALDLDDGQGWVVWLENEDGERCCAAGEELGGVALPDLAGFARRAMALHVHS